MSPTEAQQLKAIMSLARAGNPRATEALRQLRQAGMIAGPAASTMTLGDRVKVAVLQRRAEKGDRRAAQALTNLQGITTVLGDSVGFSFSQAFKYATAPVWLPAYGLYKGTKWTGQKIFGGGGGSNPEQARLAQMRAAAQRQKAAEARAAAADAQTEAELRAQQAIADAAQAEADAADAEAQQKQAAMRTAEYTADPSQALSSQDDQDSDSDDQSGVDWHQIAGIVGAR